MTTSIGRLEWFPAWMMRTPSMRRAPAVLAQAEADPIAPPGNVPRADGGDQRALAPRHLDATSLRVWKTIWRELQMVFGGEGGITTFPLLI